MDLLSGAGMTLLSSLVMLTYFGYQAGYEKARRDLWKRRRR